MEQKICVIGVYFGRLPNYFSLWLKSCESNPKIDFYIFTDCCFSDTPKNVKMIPMTLTEMKERAQRLFDFPIRLETPYKCCDYKPLYGLIFSDYVSGYDYWGHCDLDLVFGDLCYLVEMHNLGSYDRFLTLGHLSLYRNTEDVNRRYMCEGSVHNYKEVFSTDSSCVFDEIPGMTAIYLKNKFSMFTKRVFVDIATVYHRYRVIDCYSLDEKPKNYKDQIFYWENGKTFRAYFDKGRLHKEEYLYIHFQKRPDFCVTFDPSSVDAFYITNTGFYPKNGEVTKKIIKELNPYPGVLKEKYEKARRWFREQKNRIIGKMQRIFGKH